MRAHFHGERRFRKAKVDKGGGTAHSIAAHHLQSLEVGREKRPEALSIRLYGRDTGRAVVLDDVERAEGGGREERRQRRREAVAAPREALVVADLPVAAAEAADRREGVAHAGGHDLGSPEDPEVLACAAPGRAEHAEAVRLVHDEPVLVVLLGAEDLVERSDVARVGVYPLDDDVLAVELLPAQAVFFRDRLHEPPEVGHVVVAELEDAAPREVAAVLDGEVDRLVADDEVFPVGKRRNY
mmetsp:Transcript_5160/g.12600  ORF Transcript_5160/g.12600 Transcript_5160/m.12600 type:complete len:241 (-) Transcript_5160:650-1372(-)